MKASHATPQHNLTSYSLYTPCPISCPPPPPRHIQSTHRASFSAPPTPSPHNAPLSCSLLKFPLHNSFFTPHPYPTPPLVYHIPSINSPLSRTLLSGEVTWMMLCSSSEFIQLHLTLSPCKINQCASWINQSLSENQICRLDIKSYTCRSNPKINARK